MKKKTFNRPSSCCACKNKLKSSQSSQGSNCAHCTCKSQSKSQKESLTRKSHYQSVQQPNHLMFQQTQPLPLAHMYASYDQRMDMFQQQDQQPPVLTNINIRTQEAPFTSRHPQAQQPTLFQQPLPEAQLNHHFSSYGQCYSPIQSTISPFKKQSNFQQSQQTPTLTPPHRDRQSLILSPTKNLGQHYEKVLQEMELYNRERMLNLREGIAKIHEGFKSDQIIMAMREDPASSNFAFQRMKEIVDNALIAELEQQLSSVRAENITLRERALYIEQNGNSNDQPKTDKQLKKLELRKTHYKQLVRQSQEQITSLIEKLREMENDFSKNTEDYEIRLARKDGELAQCERVLSEVRAALSEKTMHHNRTQNNLSNEVTVMSDRIQCLEKERTDLIDKYTRYGDEFKQLLAKEQGQQQEKVNKLKLKVKELESKCEVIENKAKELETQARCYVKEIDDQRSKIEDLTKQTLQTGTKLKDVYDKSKSTEKDLGSKLRQEKQKYKNKIQILQQKFEQAMSEKLREIDEDAQTRIFALEQERNDFEQKFTLLSQQFESKCDQDKTCSETQQKQFEKKVDKLSQKYEQEISVKLNEAEQQFKQLEAQLRKDFKKEKKQLVTDLENLKQDKENELQDLQETCQQEFNQMSLNLRSEIDKNQKDCHDLKLKLTEAQIQRDNFQEQNQRLTSEKEALILHTKDLQSQNREEIRSLEEKLRSKVEENDRKVKEALDEAIKHHNVENLAHQYSQEIEKRQNELRLERDTKTILQNKLDKCLDDQEKYLHTQQQLKEQLQDKDLQISKIVLKSRESLSKIQHQVKMWVTKQKSEGDYLKRQFQTELEMNRKHCEGVIQQVLSKAKEQSVTWKFKVEKIQYMYEQKFQKEFSTREVEWEKAWEKREEVIKQKEKQISEITIEKTRLQDNITKLEAEVNALKNQVSSNKKEYQKSQEETKLKLQQAEQKVEEIVKRYQKQEEKMESQYKQQIQEQKLQLTQKSQEELKKLEVQMAEYREKNKKKVQDLAEHIQENQNKHRQEILTMRQIYEDKIKLLEKDLEDKQTILYENKTMITTQDLKLAQFVKDKTRLEQELQQIKTQEKQTQHELQKLQTDYDQICRDQDNLVQFKDTLENEVNGLINSRFTLESQLQQAHRQIVDQRKKLKTVQRKLHHSKRREDQEVQMLNQMLSATKLPTSTTMSRTYSIASPDFKRHHPVTQTVNSGYQTQRFSTSRGRQLNMNSSGNYNTILSEINNMLDTNPVMSGAKSSRGALNKLVLSSPSVNQLNPCSTYYHKGQQREASKENPLTMSELRHQ